MFLFSTDRRRVLISPPTDRRRLIVHGHCVELHLRVDSLELSLQRCLGEFSAGAFKVGASPMVGWIQPYNADEVVRRLPADAARVNTPDDLVEIYHREDCFWVVDDRWGLCEFNLIRGQWRSWVLPQRWLSDEATIEQAIIWPMAQLLRGRGLHLLPGVAVARDDFAGIILSTYPLVSELQALIAAHYQLLAQRWVAMRDQNERVELLHFPGWVERRTNMLAGGAPSMVVNLEDEFIGSHRDSAKCDAVMVVQPIRRARSSINLQTATTATQSLRRSWPIAELHPQRRGSPLPALLARTCRVAECQLSRTPEDLVALMDFLSGARLDSEFDPRDPSAPQIVVEANLPPRRAG